MRLKIKFTKNTTPVPSNNQNIVNGYIHKCLGENNKYHNAYSDYNISILCNGKLGENNTIRYDNGGYIIVSSFDMEFINHLTKGIMMNVSFGYGMTFAGMDFINDYHYDGWNHFKTLSPIYLKDKSTDEPITILDEHFVKHLKTRTKHKISKIINNVDLSDFDIKIHNTGSQKVKSVHLHRKNIGSMCHISIKCNKQVAQLLYDIGIGQSCGSGFGCLYHVENKTDYIWS